MVRGYGRDVSKVYVLTAMCYDVGAMVGRCAECIPYVSSLADFWFFKCVSVWVSLMVTFHPLVMLCLSMTLRSSSAIVMAALVITASLSLLSIMYLFILLLFFLWRLIAALILNWLSVFVVWSS